MMGDKKVLVVEDDFFIRELYSRALTMQGIQVMTAADGKSAIEIFDRDKPDLILLDVMLPEVSGMEVLRHVKTQAKESSNVPVMIISNLDTDESINEALSLGADSYKIKEKNPPALVVQEVKRMLGG
jgi:DNA-binding response OmpR family regulator